MIPTPAAHDPWSAPVPLWAGRLLVGGVVAWIVYQVWGGLFIPWWFNTDELVFYYEVIRQLRLDPGQTFFDIPGTPFMTLTSLLTAGWWVVERVLGMTQSANPSDFAFEHVQGVFMLMRGITLSGYAAAIGLSWSAFRQAGGLVTGVLAALLAATLPIHVKYSHFVRTESLGLVLCLAAILILLHPRTARQWKTYLIAGILAGIAMSARFHFALVGLPVLFSIYLLHDRPQLDLADEKLPRRRLLMAGTALGGLFIAGGIIALLFRTGIISANGLTHTMLLTTPAGAAEYPGAKQAVAKLWLLLGAGSMGSIILYRFPALRPRLELVLNSFTIALGLGFAGGFLFSHPTFLWRGEHQLHSIQFYSDWVDPNLESLGLWGSWKNVTHYYFTTALPELWLQCAFLAGIVTILWSRQRIAISFLIGALICFVAHPVTMKLWPHHIIPWLPFLCFVAAHPFGLGLHLLTRRFRTPVGPTILVVASAALLLAILPARFGQLREYVQLSRGRTTQIEEMNAWLLTHVPADSFIASSYYSLNSDGFIKWIESAGVSVPPRMMLFPDTHIWWLQRSTLAGHAGYASVTKADILFFRDDAERKNPGSTCNPYEEKNFVKVATFGGGVYELTVFKFDFRDLPLPSTTPAPAHRPETTEQQKSIASLQTELAALRLTLQRQEAYAAALKKALDELESKQAPWKRQGEELKVMVQQQADFIAALRSENDRLKSALVADKQQLESLAATSRQQIDFIAALEKEKNRLKAVPSANKNKLDELAATSQQQVEYIDALKKENERLTALYATHGKDIEHYVKVINEQTAYIKHLESQRQPAAP